MRCRIVFYCHLFIIPMILFVATFNTSYTEKDANNGHDLSELTELFLEELMHVQVISTTKVILVMIVSGLADTYW
ncbi:hypothetical protein ACFL27_22530 [candidate division CSSED10-310 bacterium]|uniref:Uncharacterized protein n=1 Tax=candidate division CSSED10-310 bacterium TaxID=2855610 RepID=A0ABV6Z3F8_UNCC1